MVSASDIPVLITGESGTGKELVAQAIHRHSLRALSPMFAVHLASLSAPLVESELFGHVKGSFTGAERDRQGVLEMAHGATVFFDEAGDIPLNVQVKLLRALEQREIVRVGDSLSRPADFRVIAATHCDMHKAVAEGRIRQDFFYRISGYVIALPALRERVEDIPLLANHFLQKVAPGNIFSEAALELLKQRSWPGNVRELRRAVESAAIVARGRTIQPEHVRSEQGFLPGGPLDLKESVKRWTLEQLHGSEELSHLYARMLGEVEPALLATVLEHYDQNRTLAAEKLGLDRATLRKKLGS